MLDNIKGMLDVNNDEYAVNLGRQLRKPAEDKQVDDE